MATERKIKCFLICPIGSEGTEIRRRSDKVLEHIISPTADKMGLDLIRADQISLPGIITDQIIRHLLEDELVIADLTGSNPNVFYELAIRHVTRKPVVQIIQEGEKIPFDTAAMRTIGYSFDVDRISAVREELENQISSTLKEPSQVTTPFSMSSDFSLHRAIEVKPLPGRYFIGIDIGRDKIDYCLIDYDKFEQEAYGAVKDIEGTRPTPRPYFDDIYPVLVDIVQDLSKQAAEKGIHSIDGIGLGLPGQVNPQEGLLVQSPGFESVYNEKVIRKFSDPLKQKLCKEFPIEIDNDARCATRYVWKRERCRDAICIFLGRGLGSGIVLGGRMLYGCNFTAGEIGHTTISENRELLGEAKCMCDMEGCHWEMYVSSNGMMNIAKNLDPGEYKRLKTNYEAITKKEAYQRLLSTEEFGEHFDKHFDDNNELTTYFFSLALRAGEGYAGKVIGKYIKYLAIGIANYINVINPAAIYLGGGMIRAFYDERKGSSCLERPTALLLRDEMKNYALRAATTMVSIRKGLYEEPKIPSIGAALIHKDKSYFDYKNSKEAQ